MDSFWDELCRSSALSGLHDATGGKRVGNVASASRLTVLADRLIAAAVTVGAPLHGPRRVGWQPAEDAGVDGQRG